MAKARVEKLTLSHFRGSCQSATFEFAPDKDIVLIFGENGTGKSSIADALDFVCNNEFGSLRDRSGTTPRRHVVSLNGQPKQLQVELCFGGQQWHAGLQSGRPVTVPAQPPPAFILRRTDITRVMEATAGERYKALQAYITVPKVERAEAEMRKASKDAGQEVDRAVQSRAQATETLERLWIAEGSPHQSPIRWAQHRTREDRSVLQARIQAVRTLLDAFDLAAKAQAQLLEAQDRLAAAQADLADANRALHEGTAVQVGQNDALVALLEEAQHYFQVAPATDQQCPVCGKPEAHDVLARRVQAQLAQLVHLRQLREQRQRAQTGLTYAEGALRTQQELFGQSCRDLAACFKDAPPDFLNGLNVTPLVRTSVQPDSLAAARTLIDQLTERRTVLVNALEGDQATLNQLNALQTHLQTIIEADDQMHERQAVAERLKAILAIVEGERKAYVERLMEAIASQVNELYARIHPDEPLGGATFSVKRHTAGSLELKAQFGHVDNISPTAYYSEGHLDTLGLCVHLALAKHSGAGNQIMVLDDILTSVDEGHLERIIELLVDEAPNFGHLIITTHSRVWFDRMRMANGMNADLIELYGWDLTGGIRHSRSVLPVEELRRATAAAKLDRQAVASRAGIVLEHLLDELALRYECRVPRRRDGAYTLGQLARSIDSRLAKYLVAQHIKSDGSWSTDQVKALVDRCTEYAWVRNQVGAHFNVNAAAIPDNMVRGFAWRVLNLADVLICPDCGQLPTKNKTGEYWECGGGCGKTRLRPLRAPN